MTSKAALCAIEHKNTLFLLDTVINIMDILTEWKIYFIRLMLADVTDND